MVKLTRIVRTEDDDMRIMTIGGVIIYFKGHRLKDDGNVHRLKDDGNVGDTFLAPKNWLMLD